MRPIKDGTSEWYAKAYWDIARSTPWEKLAPWMRHVFREIHRQVRAQDKGPQYMRDTRVTKPMRGRR